MASEWACEFCLLCLCLLLICVELDGRRLYNIQFENYHKGGDFSRSHNSSGPASSNSSASSTEPSDLVRHWAYYQIEPGKYYGGRAKINLWGHPPLKHYQRTESVLWVLNLDESPNIIVAGFHVCPRLYQDSKLHFFTFWTADGSKTTGCYNFQCKGFIMINWNILTPGDVIDHVSTYNGPQYYITISIRKDPWTGDWSLYREDLGTTQAIGFWPKSLFSTLAHSATIIEWGGFVSYSKKEGERGPPMGSGHYAKELEKKAAYIKKLEVFDTDGIPRDVGRYTLHPYADQEDCYKVTPLVNSGESGLHDGYLFYFGGPPGCTK